MDRYFHNIIFLCHVAQKRNCLSEAQREECYVTELHFLKIKTQGYTSPIKVITHRLQMHRHDGTRSGMPRVTIVTLTMLLMMSIVVECTSLQCLSPALEDAGSATDSSGGSGAATTNSASPNVKFAGCFNISTFPATYPTFPIIRSADDYVILEATVNETLMCAAQCGSDSTVTRMPKASDIHPSKQFIMWNASCYCLNISDAVEQIPVQGNGTSAYCPQTASLTPIVAVFQLFMPCQSLNGTGGCGASCQVSDGCCVVTPQDVPPELPLYYREMIQWVAIVVIVLAVVEAVVYACLKRRAREQAGRPARRQNVNGASIREKRAAQEITDRLLGSLPSSPTAAAEPTIQEDCCPICLDPLVDKPSLVLPCRHNIHSSCLREYLTHQLTRSNAAACPMCRATVVEEIESSDDYSDASGREVARPVRIAPLPTQ